MTTYDQTVTAKRHLLPKIDHLPITVGVGKDKDEWVVMVGVIGEHEHLIPKVERGVRVVVHRTSEAKAAGA